MKEHAMSDHWTEKLSAYLDGELTPADRRALERHLEGCAACRADTERLGRVKEWAATYAGTAPSPSVWRGVRDEIRRREGPAALPIAARRRFRIGTGLPLALAASLALVIVGVGGWLAGRATAPGSGLGAEERGALGSAGAMTIAARQTNAALLAAERYGAAIAQLEQAVLHDRSRLDSATVRVVVEKLGVIDRAIAEARAAMAQDPESAYLAEHFATMMRRKLNLLRSASAVRRS
jgi:anti-sigma factor RsiW